MVEYEKKSALCSAIEEEIEDAEESIVTETCERGGNIARIATVGEALRAREPPKQEISPVIAKRYMKNQMKWEKWKRGETVTITTAEGNTITIKGKGQTYKTGYTCDLREISFRELQEKKERLETLKKLHELFEC